MSSAKPRPSLKFDPARFSVVKAPGSGPTVAADGKTRVFWTVVKPLDLQKPDFDDRQDTIEPGLAELAESMKALAATSRENVGNTAPILIVGTKAPYEIICGRRRWLAALKAGVNLGAERHEWMSDDEKLMRRYLENAGRNGYSDTELLANVLKEDKNGKKVEWLAQTFAKTRSTIEKYLRVGRNEALFAEMKRGLPLGRALDLVAKHGDQAGAKAKEMRDEQGQDRHQKAKPGRKSNADESLEAKPAFSAKIVPGGKSGMTFDESKAKAKDFVGYHKVLSAERDRIGKLINAARKRGRGPTS